MGMISVRECTSADEVRAAALAAAAMRKRFNTPEPKPKLLTAKAANDPKPTRIVFLMQHDSHVHLWTDYVARRAMHMETVVIPTLDRMKATVKSLRSHLTHQRETIVQLRMEAEIPKSYNQIGGRTKADDVLRRMSRASGISVQLIIGGVRTAAVLRVRHLTIYQIHVECPHLPISQIGDIMGGRDHSTILNSLMRAKEILAKESSS